MPTRRPQVAMVTAFALLACEAPAPPPADLDAAWSEYHRVLEETRALLETSDQADTPTTQAEATRYLTGLIALHNQAHLHFSDPDHPILHRSVAIGNKWGFSNPDNLYLSARVEAGAAYRISGRLGTANQTTIGSYAGDTQDARAGDRIRGEDLVIEADGSFTLVLSAERTPGNWLPLDPEATSISIYQIFGDWEQETKGVFRIERIGTEGRPSPPLEPDETAARLVAAAENVRHTVRTWLAVTDQLSWIPKNTLARPREIQVASLGAWFVPGRFDLAPREALIVEFPVPERARYWGFTLYNGWSETLDYANRQTSLNARQTRIDPDGMIRLVLAAEDPGVPNWLDITGHPRGFLTWRVTSDVQPPQPETRVVALEALRESLPPETPRIDPEARRRAIEARQTHVAQRYAD
ncbi:MAG: DUF1214 domain-containing protein [Myxococcota bacterium]